MTKITNKVWQQFEDLRAEDANVFKQSDLFSAAMKKGYMELAKIIQQRRLVELISGYEQALKDKKFTRRTFK